MAHRSDLDNPLRRWLTAACIGVILSAPAGLAAAAERPIRLLAFGDSLVHGYGLPAGATFPEQLQAALRQRGYVVDVLNGGNSGDTTAAARARLDWSLSPMPDAALVELGANDGLRGLDPAATYDNLDAILARLQADGVPVLLAGMLAPRNLGADYTTEFDAVFPRLAQRHGIELYPFFLDGVALRPELNQADGIHPNEAGVAVIVERILPSVIRLLETTAGQTPRAQGAVDLGRNRTGWCAAKNIAPCPGATENLALLD